jgi:hypothetical protein
VESYRYVDSLFFSTLYFSLDLKLIWNADIFSATITIPATLPSYD